MKNIVCEWYMASCFDSSRLEKKWVCQKWEFTRCSCLDQGPNNIGVVVWAAYPNNKKLIFFSFFSFIVGSLKLVMKVIMASLLVANKKGERAKHDKERGITRGFDEKDN